MNSFKIVSPSLISQVSELSRMGKSTFPAQIMEDSFLEQSIRLDKKSTNKRCIVVLTKNLIFNAVSKTVDILSC